MVPLRDTIDRIIPAVKSSCSSCCSFSQEKNRVEKDMPVFIHVSLQIYRRSPPVTNEEDEMLMVRLKEQINGNGRRYRR